MYVSVIRASVVLERAYVNTYGMSESINTLIVNKFCEHVQVMCTIMIHS